MTYLVCLREERLEDLWCHNSKAYLSSSVVESSIISYSDLEPICYVTLNTRT